MFPSLRFQRNRNTFVHVSDRSVSGITNFRTRYHVNKLQKRKITFGNKFISCSSFGGNVELRCGYVLFVCLFFFFCLHPFPLCVLTTSMSPKNYFHTQMPIFLVVNIYKFNLHEFCHTIIVRAGKSEKEVVIKGLIILMKMWLWKKFCSLRK